MTLVVVIGVVVVAAIVVGLVVRSRRSADTVDSFRRGLDALSPEARRPVIDQVHRVSRPEDELDRSDTSSDDEEDDDGDGDEDGSDAPGGARGT